jgi:hypothetical protein
MKEENQSSINQITGWFRNQKRERNPVLTSSPLTPPSLAAPALPPVHTIDAAIPFAISSALYRRSS